jgi:hypothetical protein
LQKTYLILVAKRAYYTVRKTPPKQKMRIWINAKYIFSLLFVQEKYLQMIHSPYSSTTVYFSANDCRSINVKFVLRFVLLNQQVRVPGFMVDIR